MPASTRLTAEHARLADLTPAIVPQWRRWGCYVTERAWGTVREDYSAGGDAWSYLPHDQAQTLIDHGQVWQDRGAKGWRRVVDHGAASESQLHLVLIDFARAEDSSVRPDGHARRV